MASLLGLLCGEGKVVEEYEVGRTSNITLCVNVWSISTSPEVVYGSLKWKLLCYFLICIGLSIQLRKWLHICMCVHCKRTTLTVVCLEGLGLDHLAAVAAHHQVEVVLCGTLAKYGHVCAEGKNQPHRTQVKEGTKKMDLLATHSESLVVKTLSQIKIRWFPG